MNQIIQCFSKSPKIKFNLNIENLLFHGHLSFTFIFLAVKINILMNFDFKIWGTCEGTVELAHCRDSDEIPL